MKRFSLRHFVIVTPLLAALAAGWYAADVRRERENVITSFNLSVERDDALNLGWATQVLGKDAVVRRLQEAQQLNPNFVFDGGVRFAQIIPDAHDNGRGPGDGYNLCGFGGSVGASVWTGPAGMRISSLAFDGDQLKIQLHGDLVLGSNMCSIPRESPDEYIIAWPTESPDPSPHDLNAMIAERHAESLIPISEGQ